VVKPILQLYPMIHAESEEERAAIRPAGRNSERYHETVHGMTELVKAAEDLGFWGASCVEHHFHSEGYEVGPNPGILNSHWAAVTDRINIGSLGYTMSAQNPLRVAEESAMLDHLCDGRYFVGFSRGYMSRWTNVLGQHLGVAATSSPEALSAEQREELGAQAVAAESAKDVTNREAFAEHIDMVVDAWTQETITHQSARWQIPYPPSGIEWKAHETTERLGAHGEIGPDGTVERICVTPSPYTKPHPPVFVASNASQETVEFCGRRGFVPTYFSRSDKAEEFGRLYAERAREAGFDFAPGQNQAVVRWMQIGDTPAEARQAIADYDAEIFANLYQPLTAMSAGSPDPVQSVLDSGLWTCGTAAEVRDQFVAQWEMIPAEYVVLIFHYAQQPIESVISNLEKFMDQVKPSLDELTDYSEVVA
jgi:alkanesulfonate monooxygenase SsuD/methylene tetrahydromethanopterin reductase-like flavin-dependent oxidoreductase (luciferase family)